LRFAARSARRKAADHGDGCTAGRFEALREFSGERHPEVGKLRHDRAMEFGFRDADDGRRFAIQRDRLADDPRHSLKGRLPR
jgi:hypothetical protein